MLCQLQAPFRHGLVASMVRFFVWLVLLVPAQAIAQSPACVQVQVTGQGSSAFNCLNQQLQQEVEGAAPTQSKLPISATSPSNQVGTFNEQSLSEQYGQNFGKSAVPYRPPPPVFNSSLSH